jgi:hypothetical protein
MEREAGEKIDRAEKFARESRFPDEDLLASLVYAD